MGNPSQEFVIVALRNNRDQMIEESDETIGRNPRSRQYVTRDIAHPIGREVVLDHLIDAGARPGLIILWLFHLRSGEGYNSRCIINAIEKKLADLDDSRWADCPGNFAPVNGVEVMNLYAHASGGMGPREIIEFNSLCAAEDGRLVVAPKIHMYGS